MNSRNKITKQDLIIDCYMLCIFPAQLSFSFLFSWNTVSNNSNGNFRIIEKLDRLIPDS